jgi:hypothetical protein
MARAVWVEVKNWFSFGWSIAFPLLIQSIRFPLAFKNWSKYSKIGQNIKVINIPQTSPSIVKNKNYPPTSPSIFKNKKLVQECR